MAPLRTHDGEQQRLASSATSAAAQLVHLPRRPLTSPAPRRLVQVASSLFCIISLVTFGDVRSFERWGRVGLRSADAVQPSRSRHLLLLTLKPHPKHPPIHSRAVGPSAVRWCGCGLAIAASQLCKLHRPYPPSCSWPKCSTSPAPATWPRSSTARWQPPSWRRFSPQGFLLRPSLCWVSGRDGGAPQLLI